MAVYVALLRGINVGGKNKVDMKILKKTFEKVGMSTVITYINSGNIIFSSQKKKNELSTILEKAILNDLKLDIKVVIRNLKDIEEIIKSLPKSWKNDTEMKSDVMFLWEEVDNKEVLKEITIKGIDTVKYVEGALLWSVKAKDITKSGKMKLVGTKLYKKMTIRNVNTARKIYELMLAT